MSKKIYKSRSNKMLTGVCGGVADYLDMDATIVRLICACIMLSTGIGIAAYVLAAIIIPFEDKYDDTVVNADGYKESDYE